MKTLKLSFILTILISTIFASCDLDPLCVQGRGKIVTKTLNIPDFSGVDFAEAGEVVISQGLVQKVKVTGNQDIIDRIKDEVYNDLWIIDLGKGCFDYDELSFEITIPEITDVTLSGSGEIVVNDFADLGDLDLKISGSGSIDFNKLDGTENLDVQITGSGTIKGHRELALLNNLDIEIRGSGDFNGYQLDADYCDVNIAGSGNCYISVREELDVKISGSGNVYYHGSPDVTEKITGSGKVVKTN